MRTRMGRRKTTRLQAERDAAALFGPGPGERETVAGVFIMVGINHHSTHHSFEKVPSFNWNLNEYQIIVRWIL